MKTRAWILISPAALLLAARCAVSPVAGGGGEVTNGVCTVAGSSRSGVSVTAFPVDYIPNKSDVELFSAVSDSTGAFALDLPDGLFNVYLVDTVIQCGAFCPDIQKGFDLGNVELDSLGSISGTVVRPSTGGTDPIDVYIAGSPFFDILNGDLDFMLLRIPPCSYTLTVGTIKPKPCNPGQVCSEPGDSVSAIVPVTVTEGESVLVDTVHFD